MSDKAIDAVAELDALDADRGPATLQDTRRRLPRGARIFSLLLMAVAVLVTTWAIWLATQKEPPAPREPEGSIEVVVAGLNRSQAPAAPQIPPPAPPVVEPTSYLQSGSVGGFDLSKLDLPDVMPNMIKQRRLQSPLSGPASQHQGQPYDTEPIEPAHTATVNAPAFARRLEALDLAPAKARLLGNRDMLVTQGTSIDCTMLPRLVTSQAGMVTCVAPVDVYSSSGRVKLIDKGSKFTGYQQSGFSQGQNRVFVVWSRMESPNGVVVNLDSPGTGPLGESGLGGHIDHHFWERFGNAIMISMISDIGTWAANSSSNSSGSIRFDSTRDGATDAVSKVLEHSVDIPPTLYKNQADRIAIMVVRDLDFSDVYELKLISGR